MTHRPSPHCTSSFDLLTAVDPTGLRSIVVPPATTRSPWHERHPIRYVADRDLGDEDAADAERAPVTYIPLGSRR